MFLRNFCRDERGSVLIYFTIVMLVLFGLVGLATAGAKFMMLNSKLQDAADAAALAAANELTGQPGSIANAIAVAQEWGLKNEVGWLSDDGITGNQIATIHVCDTLNVGVPGCHETGVDADAEYVEVTTVQRGVVPGFLAAVGVTSTANTTATATAVSFYVACNVQPLMLCNPNFPNDFSATPGDLYGFTINGNTPDSPGNFNLLDPGGQTQSSAPQIRNLLSQSRPNLCYVDSVSPRPGAIAQDVAQGVNARFDVRPNGGGTNMAGMDWTPDVNVIKGNDQNSCFASVSNGNSPLDPGAELPGSPPGSFTDSGGGTIYSSTIDPQGEATYMAAHHASAGTWPSGWTRYDMYKHELAGDIAFDGSSAETIAKSPTCNGVAGAADRRILSVAIINCDPNNPVTGNKYKFLESRTYADFFLTRPVGPDNVIWAEFVRFLTPQSDGSKLKHIVELVR